MEQRRGGKFIREFIIVGFCENVVANGLSDTGCFCENCVANGLSDTGWTFGTDLDIGTDLFIGTDWIFGTDLVIGSGFIIGTVWTSFIECIIDDGGERQSCRNQKNKIRDDFVDPRAVIRGSRRAEYGSGCSAVANSSGMCFP